MIELKLPSLGADMDWGTLLEWKVAPGETVTRGQVIAVVDTAKAAVEIESWEEGTVSERLLEPGVKTPVGTPMLRLLAPGESAETAVPPGVAPGPGERPRVSPAARRRAEELGVAVAGLTGSGPGGALTLADVEQAAANAVPEDKGAAMRAQIARAMSRSKREIPHFYLSETIPLARADAWLKDWNAAHGVAERLLPAALLLKATALAVRGYPELNGFWRDGRFEPAAGVHLGVAISLRQGGLVAPALRDAADKPLPQLMAELTDLVARARSGSLRSGELADATLTVSQLGEQGAESVLGVIYPPQVALVGFGRIATRPWGEDGELRALPTVVASLAADHRVSDGHRAGRFLVALRELLQSPETL